MNTRIENLALAVRCIYDSAAVDDADLFGYSLLDLVADQLPRVSLADLRSAIIVAGLHAIVNTRLQAEIAKY
jgi:hypothetical protein